MTVPDTSPVSGDRRARRAPFRRAPRWLHLLDSLIPAALKAQGPDPLRRARLAIGIVGAALAGVAWSATEERILGTRLFPALAAMLIPVLVAIAWLLHRTASLRLAGNLLAGVLFTIAMGITALSGGGYVGALVFLPIVPALAALIAGRRAALAWAVVTCAGLIAVARLVNAGLSFPVTANPEFVAAAKFRVTGIVVVWLSVITLLHESLKDAALADVAESEARYRSLAESSPLGILACDARGTVLIANRSIGLVLESLGVDAARLGDVLREPTLRRLGVAELFERCLAQNEVIESEVRVQRAGGGERVLEVRLAPLRGPRRGVYGAEALIEDVTARRRAAAERAAFERQLHHTQKLETLGLLSSRVAHDFNNLLTAIKGNAELLLRQIPAADPKHERAERIELATRHAAELTGQLLAYAGKGERRIVRVCVNDVVGDMARLLETAVPAGVTIEADLADTLPMVRADRDQLRQVVMNLITNAGEAIGDAGGTVRVRTRAVELAAGPVAGSYLPDALPGGVYTVVEVADDGCGMDATVQARVFDPFFSTKADGRGLGLSALVGIVRAHRGALQLESTPGRGTTFRILLPGADLTDDADAPRTVLGDGTPAAPPSAPPTATAS